MIYHGEKWLAMNLKCNTLQIIVSHDRPLQAMINHDKHGQKRWFIMIGNDVSCSDSARMFKALGDYVSNFAHSYFSIRSTPPFPSSTFCLLVAPCQAIDSKHLSSIVNHLPSMYMPGNCLADGWLCLTSAWSQSLDKEQQANRKCLTEMVVYQNSSYHYLSKIHTPEVLHRL